MEIKKSLTLIILLFISTACQSIVGLEVAETPRIVTTETLVPLAFPSPTGIKNVDTPVPTLTHPRPIPTQTDSPTPQKEELQLYSPLAEHAVEQLHEIVSSPYDPPPLGDDARHHGVDFCYYNGEVREFIEGEGIQAILSGVVAASQADRLPYGNMVIIETLYEELPQEIISVLEIQPGESLYHLYAHFIDAPKAALGNLVEGGQTLGQVGKSGYNIIVSHLHFETRLGPSGAVFESMAYYDVDAAQAEKEAYKLWRTSGAFRHFDPMKIFQAYLEEEVSP